MNPIPTLIFFLIVGTYINFMSPIKVKQIVRLKPLSLESGESQHQTLNYIHESGYLLRNCAIMHNMARLLPIYNQFV